ncbi:MAG: transglutaminase-like domain-containing protein, partial [Bacteroidales bacterium]|nr:transglutaminase-like domain-containing protein [Bacteroidales bacterium]
QFPPKGRPLTMEVGRPKLALAPSGPKTLSLRGVSKVTVQTNQNLLDYYACLPKSARWTSYAAVSLSDEVKATLYPALSIVADDELAAVNRLLDFVQTAFAYLDDQSQFGYERPLYPEETLFYPYSDCDDRAILFANLVNDLIGLETAFLNYHNHVAVGVHFNQPVPGETVELEGKTYAVCDPTSIGVNVGKLATKMQSPKITPILSTKMEQQIP